MIVAMELGLGRTSAETVLRRLIHRSPISVQYLSNRLMQYTYYASAKCPSKHSDSAVQSLFVTTVQSSVPVQGISYPIFPHSRKGHLHINNLLMPYWLRGCFFQGGKAVR